MNAVSLFVTFCGLININGHVVEQCRDVEFKFVAQSAHQLNPRNCTMNMQMSPDVRDWVLRHPDWAWRRWSCERGDRRMAKT